ncbi:MAG: hypothetical protein CSA96_06985 [Bacteroidetes bacterium]|nr:MAG: hypothetical protein CSA96_06985 [Bacteroidota bacterium]
MTIHQFQKQCFTDYCQSIQFPSELKYVYGNPVSPVIPIETAVGKIMIIAPLPGVRMNTIDDIPDVPVGNSNAPFSTEAYYDGSQVRSSLVGQELDEVILEALGIERDECWLTSMVKVHLFDELQVKKYHRLGVEIQEQRSHFMEYANNSMKWIRDEIEIANPLAIVLMGAEVIANMLLVSLEEAQSFITGEIVEKTIIWKNSNFICLPAPGEMMDRSARNPWPRQFALRIAPAAKKAIAHLKAQPRI